MDKVIKVTGKGKVAVKPEFSIEYTVTDSEAAKDELPKNAISDSKHKAELLEEVSGLSLNEIQSINYSWGEIEFVCGIER